jgi:hypothetical protein
LEGIEHTQAACCMPCQSFIARTCHRSFIPVIYFSFLVASESFVALCPQIILLKYRSLFAALNA